MKVDWRLRPQALEIGAVVANSEATISFLTTWLDRLAAPQRQAHREVHVQGLSILFGAPHSLPWYDGIAYAGVCASAPQLWLPTHLDPGLPLDLLERAVLRRANSTTALLWHAPSCVVALA